MREMNGPVSWLEAGWLSLPSAEAPVGTARVNLFRRRQSPKPLTVAGPRRIHTGFQKCMARSSHFSCGTKPIIHRDRRARAHTDLHSQRDSSTLAGWLMHATTHSI